MNAISAALEKAGYKSATERLREIATNVLAMNSEQLAEYCEISFDADRDRIQRRLMQVAKEAIKASPRNWDGAKDAFYAKVRKDVDLLWELLAPYRSQAVQLLLTRAAGEVREEQRSSSPLRETGGAPGQRCRENQKQLARRADLPESKGGQDVYVGHAAHAPRASAMAGAAAVSAVARLSLLDTFKVNGQPIGDLTPAEANKWADSRERDSRFVRLLTANLPQDQPIKKYRTPDEAQALYAQAEAGRAE